MKEGRKDGRKEDEGERSKEKGKKERKEGVVRKDERQEGEGMAFPVGAFSRGKEGKEGEGR